MFGTVARYQLKAGRSEQFLSELKGFEDSPPPGWFYHTVFRSTNDPDELWMSVVFESEEAYRRNADSPEMDKEYRRLLDHMRAEPEWHDGHVVHEAMHKGAPA
ncbi:MAG: putative quinol monooxygenase [Candidatus Dormibacterales bacterium]